MTNNLKCRDCKPPTRYPGCHSKCKYYIEWKEQHDAENARIAEKKWLDGLSRTSLSKSRRRKKK